MRVQIDRFEDNGWAVLLPYPEGRATFDVPRELLPEEVSAGDVFDVRFEYDGSGRVNASSANELTTKFSYSDEQTVAHDPHGIAVTYLASGFGITQQVDNVMRTTAPP